MIKCLNKFKFWRRIWKKKAVNHFSVKLTNGVYGLLGANGAGKTTLFQLLLRFYDAQAGVIER